MNWEDYFHGNTARISGHARRPQTGRRIALRGQVGRAVKDETFEAIRMVIPKGHEMSRHQVDGAITIYCLDGRIAFTAGGKTHDLKAGHWLFLLGNEPHSLVGIEDASVLLTIMFPSEGRVSRLRMTE